MSDSLFAVNNESQSHCSLTSQHITHSPNTHQIIHQQNNNKTPNNKNQLQTNNTPNGYKLHIFENKSICETLQCSKCSLIPSKPFTCNEGHIFCELCSNTIHHICPGNQQSNQHSIQSPTVMNAAIRNMIKMQRVFCYRTRNACAKQINEDLEGDAYQPSSAIFSKSFMDNTIFHHSINDCQWNGYLKDLQKHLENDCDFKLHSCDFHSIGCQNRKYGKKELIQHKIDCNEKHTDLLLKKLNEYSSVMFDLQSKVECLTKELKEMKWKNVQQNIGNTEQPNIGRRNVFMVDMNDITNDDDIKEAKDCSPTTDKSIFISNEWQLRDFIAKESISVEPESIPNIMELLKICHGNQLKRTLDIAQIAWNILQMPVNTAFHEPSPPVFSVEDSFVQQNMNEEQYEIQCKSEYRESLAICLKNIHVNYIQIPVDFDLILVQMLMQLPFWMLKNIKQYKSKLIQIIESAIIVGNGDGGNVGNNEHCVQFESQPVPSSQQPWVGNNVYSNENINYSSNLPSVHAISPVSVHSQNYMQSMVCQMSSPVELRMQHQRRSQSLNGLDVCVGWKANKKWLWNRCQSKMELSQMEQNLVISFLSELKKEELDGFMANPMMFDEKIGGWLMEMNGPYVDE